MNALSREDLSSLVKRPLLAAFDLLTCLLSAPYCDLRRQFPASQLLSSHPHFHTDIKSTTLPTMSDPYHHPLDGLSSPGLRDFVHNMMKSSPHSEQSFETDSILHGGTPLQPASPKSFAKTDSDADGQLSFVPSTTISRDDGSPQDLLLVGSGRIDGEKREVFALSWVSRAGGGARTHYYFLDSQGKHKTTAYDKVQKWLPGFWTAQITNGDFDEQRTRALRILSLFHNKESLEEAMSTVFDPNNRVTDQEIMGATYVDDDDSGKDLREQFADEDDFDSLFDGSQAESEDDALTSLDEGDDRADRNKLTVSEFLHIIVSTIPLIPRRQPVLLIKKYGCGRFVLCCQLSCLVLWEDHRSARFLRAPMSSLWHNSTSVSRLGEDPRLRKEAHKSRSRNVEDLESQEP